MVFDVTKQEWKYYQKILDASDMVVPEYGVKGTIIELTATHYIQEIARITRTSYDSHMHILKKEPADRKNIEYLKMLEVPIAIPVINYTCGAQEGRHRAIAFAELHGEDAKFPCLTIYWIDKQKKGLSFWQWMHRNKAKRDRQ